MGTLKHIIYFFPFILVACSTSQNFPSPQFQASPTLLRNTQSQTATHTAPANLLYPSSDNLVLLTSTVTQSPFPVATSTMLAYPIMPYPYPQPVSPQPQEPIVSPTSTPTLEPPGVLNRKDPLSLVRWFQYGLENQNLSFINPLLVNNIRYSVAYADSPGEILSKETFLSELERRLSNHPSCFSYVVQLGEINTLNISTVGWNPPWEFEGAEWDYLVLSFSDQWTKEEGLYLYGAFVSYFRGLVDPNETSCR